MCLYHEVGQSFRLVISLESLCSLHYALHFLLNALQQTCAIQSAFCLVSRADPGFGFQVPLIIFMHFLYTMMVIFFMDSTFFRFFFVTGKSLY
jgi:hypothetical protein